LNHSSHNSVGVVRMTFKVYGKRQTLTLSQPKTLEPIVTKFEWHDYVMDPYQQHIDTVSVMQAISPFVIFAVFDVQVLKCCR